LLCSRAYAAPYTVLSSGKVYCGGETQPALVKKASYGIGPGDTTIIAAVSGKKLRVLSWTASASAAGNLTFESSTTTTIGGTYYTPANGFIAQNCAPYWCFETTAGELLNGAAVTATYFGELTYIECD
jgi:hypothetical protein